MATDYWTAGSGNWGTDADWSLGSQPDDDAVIGTGPGGTVVVDGTAPPVFINSLSISSGYTVQNTAGSGYFFGAAAESGTIAGTLELMNGSFFSFAGTLTDTGTISITGADHGGGSVLASEGGQDQVTNNNLIEATNGGSISAFFDLTINGTGTIMLSDGFITGTNAPNVKPTVTIDGQTVEGSGSIGSNMTALNIGAGTVIDANIAGSSNALKFEKFRNFDGPSITVQSGGEMEATAGGWLEIAAPITNNGIIAVGADSTVDLLSGGLIAGNVTFAGHNGTLEFATGVNQLSGDIFGALSGDRIDLQFQAFASGDKCVWQQNGSTGTLRLETSGGSVLDTLTLAGHYSSGSFTPVSDGHGGTNIEIRLGAQVDDFNFDRTSDILFRNDSSGDTWVEVMSNAAFSNWSQIGGSNTSFTAAGVGDFYGTGTDGVLFRNTSTGDTWIETISNAGFASWNQIGGSDTHYSVVGVADLYGNGTDDILFRNTTTGDTWFEAISNGAFAGWNQIGGSDTNYAIVGTGDFYDNGTDDILFRNNSIGDTWIEQMSNGAFNGWHQIGGSDTHFSVVGVGDFYGNGTDDILFRNNSTGDTWIEQISNGGFKSWQQVGGSDTSYAVVGVGDYFANGTQDILFRNNSTGDTWIEALSNGQFNGWHQVGGSNTSYTVKT